MANALLHIQCTHEGKLGTFLRYPDKTLASPICSDLATLAAWCNANGWYPLPYDGTTPYVSYTRV